MAARARGVELIVHRLERGDVPGARRAKRRASGVEHQLRVRHPAILVARASGHHEQVRRLGDSERLALQLAPLGLAGGRARRDVEDRVR